jgi:hypothetical protein
LTGRSGRATLDGWPRSCWPAERTRSPHFYGTTFVGRDPYCIARERDLEGIVAKSARGRCQSDGRSTSGLKIKNEDYSRDGAALNGRRLYWGGNSQTVPLLNSPALGQKRSSNAV